ncbi:UDP-glucose 4-epimerase GalE [Candidatus Methylopumilus universalis]|jgi:UDP-glucose 4-epimerase|uniref:UDP-glucose 4-epimerase GalE n=1 Tax=Candidatus Methylopumilus universalis TaxID=2588536 RepID=UPI00111F224F|nr:UDP-glucose 4-epimerase GalE [Candidatus Methylopumilus universalis]QDC70776.1 UDP-glucose 4-epimerase GalE [Candidatus Methylopumilus universalis]
MNILVVGGAGFIGSHMVKRLLVDHHNVIVIDNLSKGFRDAVICDSFFEVDIIDKVATGKVFANHSIDVVFHFASFIEVGESVKFPEKYFKNNFEATRSLLDIMVQFQVKQFVFSSTAAVFGNPEYSPIDEAHPKHPINPYGESKLMVEKMLEEFDKEYGLKSVSLRYFNAAGADPQGELGERHNPETHLIPLVLQAASGRRDAISIFGDDYDTPDGTCIRDYIHITDLADAHIRAIEYLRKGNQSAAFNLGNGKGFSVREIIDAAENVTNKKIPIRLHGRRAGDPATLVADAKLANKVLGWKPEFTNIRDIIQHAWNWENKFPW